MHGMHRGNRLLLTLVSIMLGSITAAGQLTIAFNLNNPDYLIPNAPFTLTRTTRDETRLQNGSYLNFEEHERLTRDAKGRLFDQMTPVSGDPLALPAKAFLLADPVAHTVTEWSSNHLAAIQTTIPTGAHFQFVAMQRASLDRTKLPPSVTTTAEDLGSQQIAGLLAKGTRTTLLVPANVMGNTAPLRYVTEVWISPELGIPVRELELNPLTGTRRMNTETIELNAGADALFHLPAGLNVRTVKTLGYPVAHDAEQIAYNKALDDLKAPETREAAADIVVSYAQQHNDVAAYAAFMLAIRKTHLAQAKTLAEGAVLRMEQTTATLAPGSNGPGNFEEMASLAQAWDYLGAAYAASGDADPAKRLFHSAWLVGGRGMTLDRLAQLEVHNNDRPAALHDDLMALQGEVDSRDTDEITRRAQRLGNPQPTPLPDPESLFTVPDAGRLRGDARFDVLFRNTGEAAVTWVDGSPELKALVPALNALKLSAALPDVGPEHVLRRVRLACQSDGPCQAVWLYAWQAEQPPATASIHP